MRLAKPIAFVTLGLLVLATSLFSRDRDKPAWASNGLAAATAPDPARSHIEPTRAPGSPVRTLATRGDEDAPGAATPGASTDVPTASTTPAPVRSERSARSACGARPCPQRRTRPSEPVGHAAPAPDPIQFRLADRG